jgi:hypothetical protein
MATGSPMTVGLTQCSRSRRPGNRLDDAGRCELRAAPPGRHGVGIARLTLGFARRPADADGDAARGSWTARSCKSTPGLPPGACCSCSRGRCRPLDSASSPAGAKLDRVDLPAPCRPSTAWAIITVEGGCRLTASFRNRGPWRDDSRSSRSSSTRAPPSTTNDHRDPRRVSSTSALHVRGTTGGERVELQQCVAGRMSSAVPRSFATTSSTTGQFPGRLRCCGPSTTWEVAKTAQQTRAVGLPGDPVGFDRSLAAVPLRSSPINSPAGHPASEPRFTG